MRRTPTTTDAAYAWHRKALAGDKPQVTNEPQCGWFVRRLIRNGPFVPASIYFEAEVDPDTGELLGDETMRCEVAGEQRDPEDEWLWLASRPISEAEYAKLLGQIFTDAPYQGPQRPRNRWLTQPEESTEVTTNWRKGSLPF